MDLNTMKDKLGISREDLELGLIILETHGYIEKTSIGEACRSCEFYNKCCSISTNLYRITEKGITHIKEEDKTQR